MIDLSAAAKRTEYRAQNALRTQVEKGMARSVLVALRTVGHEAAAEYGLHGTTRRAIYDHYHALYRVYKTYYARAYTVFGLRALRAIRAQKFSMTAVEGKNADTEFEQSARRFVAEWAGHRSLAVSKSTSARIDRAIAKGAAEGSTDQEVADLIVGAVGDEARALTIARTEMHAASQDAAFEAAQASGLSVTKEWVATEDDRTREDHAAANGDNVAMHESFKIGIDELLYPGDPSGLPEQVINCRCVLVFNGTEG